ncbi:MAG: serine/threonine-protein kinase, partial [Polyangiaceae bacterium]
LKVFKAFGDFSAEDRQKLLDEFIQEGALLADLSARTAAIVQARDIGMLDAGDGTQIPFMVLEWLEGSTLEGVLTDERRRSLALRTVEEAVRLLDPVAEALALAHRKGIAHRDVKPGNVFVIGDPRGESTVKLLDFGIAKVVSDAQKMAGSFTKTSGQVTSFTPAYGAPEQFSRTHGATGPWSDVFSLALIVSEIVTGREALEGDDFMQLGFASANPDRRPTPRALGAKVGDNEEVVLAKALAVKPGERWQSAGDFWSALRRAVAMAPMSVLVDPKPPSGALPAIEVGAATVAAESHVSPAVATLPSRPPGTSVTQGRRSKSKGALIGLVIGGVAIAGGAVVFRMSAGAGSGTGRNAVASASAKSSVVKS